MRNTFSEYYLRRRAISNLVAELYADARLLNTRHDTGTRSILYYVRLVEIINERLLRRPVCIIDLRAKETPVVALRVYARIEIIFEQMLTD